MELHRTDLAGDSLKKINEDTKITVEELKELNGLKLKELAAVSAKERTMGVPVKPGDGASHEEQKDYEIAKNAYDNKVAILDKFDNGLAKLKESYEASKAELLKQSGDELAKLEAEIGIVKPEPAKVETVTAAPAEEKKVVTGAPTAQSEAAKAETVAPATAPAEAKDAPKTTEYVVKPGDNLSKIAKEHGATSWQELKKMNNIADENKIHVGQKLKVPAKAEKTATDTEAAASAKKPEAAKGGKAAEDKASDAKPADKPKAATDKEAVAKSEPKTGEAPSATTTLSERAKIDAKPKSGPTNQTYVDISQTAPKAAGGPSKSQKA